MFIEKLVLKALLILNITGFVEIIHVHLADEWRVIVVFEVFGEHLGSELIGVVDDEAVASFVPEDVLVEGFVIDDFVGGVYEVGHFLLE